MVEKPSDSQLTAQPKESEEMPQESERNEIESSKNEMIAPSAIDFELKDMPY